MNEDTSNSEQEVRRQILLKRRRRERYLISGGTIMMAVSLLLALLPSAVAAFTGTVSVGLPWDDYLGILFIFGLALLIAGIISRIAPDMMEGDALWIFKMGPFDPR